MKPRSTWLKNFNFGFEKQKLLSNLICEFKLILGQYKC